MPQTSPMLWTILLTMTWGALLSFNVMGFFTTIKNPHMTKTHTSSTPSKTWKW